MTAPPDSCHDTGHLRSVFAGTRSMVRTVYRDPEHVSERLTLLFAERIGEPSRDWSVAAMDGRSPAERPLVAAELVRRSASLSRIDGAIAGTPFLIALVPGYVAHLWQEAVVVLRTAALYGRDPTELRTAAEFLVLRGTHGTLAEAEQALAITRATPEPPRPTQRRSIRNWIEAVRTLGVFGGFLSAPEESSAGRPAWPLTLVKWALVGVLWAITWILPLTFMLAMAWGCESDARDLGRRAIAFYGGTDAHTRAAGTGRASRPAVRSAGVALSLAVPIGFVIYANHIRSHTGIGPVTAAGAVVALSLVVAMAIVARRI